MPREFFSISPVTDVNLDGINQLVSEINTRLTDVTVALAQLEGFDSFQPKILKDLDLSGKRIVNVGASKSDNDAVTRGELRRDIRTVSTKFPTGGLTLTQVQASFVSLTGDQLIGGNKTFTGSVKVGATGTAITALLIASAALNFGNTLAQASSDLTIVVTGAVGGNVVILGVPNAAVLADSCYTAWVSAADTVTVRFSNYSALAQNPASGTFTVAVIQ